MKLSEKYMHVISTANILLLFEFLTTSFPLFKDFSKTVNQVHLLKSVSAQIVWQWE